MTSEAPRVVACLQAPALLNRLADSPRWKLEVATLGDEAYAEKCLLRAPLWDGLAAGVEAVLVCSDQQLFWARENLPSAKILWAAHCSLPGIVTALARRRSAAVVTFCERNRRVVESMDHGLPTVALTAAYAPASRWRWRANTAWTMASRPEHRVMWWNRTIKAALAHARASGVAFVHTVYGEGQPGGFLAGEARRMVEEASSCYLGRCVENTGMGLVEHECWEMGSPVVAAWAGDLYDGLTQERMNADFVGCLLVKSCAEAHADRGMQHLLDHNSPSHRDRSIERLLDVLAGASEG